MKLFIMVVIMGLATLVLADRHQALVVTNTMLVCNDSASGEANDCNEQDCSNVDSNRVCVPGEETRNRG
jgi:hypothetical protein